MIAASFTQIVWQNTLGIGMTYEKKGKVFAVLVKYSPPRNIINEFKSNVPRPIRMDQGGSFGNY